MAHNSATRSEAKRHNTAVEAETQRSNFASEYETHRRNVVSESQNASKLAEDIRHNLAVESETARSNKAKEELQHESNSVSYATGMANAEARRYGAEVNLYNTGAQIQSREKLAERGKYTGLITDIKQAGMELLNLGKSASKGGLLQKADDALRSFALELDHQIRNNNPIFGTGR